MRRLLGSCGSAVRSGFLPVVLLLCRNNHRAFVMRSTDDGLTFTEPREITESIRTPEFDWTRVASGPGNGIQIQTGGMPLVTE